MKELQLSSFHFGSSDLPLIRVDGCMRVCASQNNSYGGQRRHGWRVQRLLGLRVAQGCACVSRSSRCVCARLFALPPRWQFNQTASIWLERATHPCGCVHVCVCFTTMAGGRWLHGTASAVAGAASAASPRYVRSKGSGCCTRWRSRHSRAMAGPLIRVDGCICVCASQRWRWWSMDAWLARSRLLALLAAELCVRFA